jgi:hypothetical protein
MGAAKCGKPSCKRRHCWSTRRLRYTNQRVALDARATIVAHYRAESGGDELMAAFTHVTEPAAEGVPGRPSECSPPPFNIYVQEVVAREKRFPIQE